MLFPLLKDTMHPLAEIFKEGVLDSKEFSFNHVGFRGIFQPHVFECNGLFPSKDNRTFFFWKNYSKWLPYDEYHDDPDYLYSDYKRYIIDGSTRYWNGTVPRYNDYIKCISKYDHDVKIYYLNRDSVPMRSDVPCDETPTDIMRRELYYVKEKCVWGLLDCKCSESIMLCMKTQCEAPLCKCDLDCKPWQNIHNLGGEN